MRKALGVLCTLATLSVAGPSEAYNLAPRHHNVDGVLASVSARHGLPLSFMRTFGRIESNMNPRARTGQYGGLFQLSDYVFRRHGGRGSRYDPEQNATAFANFTLVNAAKFRSTMGREPTGEELYLMHQQGAAGAMAHKRAPNRPAWENVRRYYPSESVAKKAIWGNMTKQWKRRFGRVENVTSGDFMEAWGRQYRAKEGKPEKPSVITVAAGPTLSKSTAPKDREKYLDLADKNLRLNKRETRLYERHLDNLYGSGGVDDGLGGRATLLSDIVSEGGRYYIVPRIWDGEVLKKDEALKLARKESLRRFPAYSSKAKAEARLRDIHEYMDMDSEVWLSAQVQIPPIPSKAKRPSISKDWIVAGTKDPVGPSELDVVSQERAAKPPEAPTLAAAVGETKQPFKLPDLPPAAIAILGLTYRRRVRQRGPAIVQGPNQMQIPLRDLFRAI